jgi:hypothetical protein
LRAAPSWAALQKAGEEMSPAIVLWSGDGEGDRGVRVCRARWRFDSERETRVQR